MSRNETSQAGAFGGRATSVTYSAIEKKSLSGERDADTSSHVKKSLNASKKIAELKYAADLAGMTGLCKIIGKPVHVQRGPADPLVGDNLSHGLKADWET